MKKIITTVMKHELQYIPNQKVFFAFIPQFYYMVFTTSSFVCQEPPLPPQKEFLSITNRFDMIDSLDVDVPWHPTYLPCSKKMQLYLFVWIKKLCSCISCQHMNHSYLSPLIYVDQQITQLSVVLVN